MDLLYKYKDYFELKFIHFLLQAKKTNNVHSKLSFSPNSESTLANLLIS